MIRAAPVIRGALLVLLGGIASAQSIEMTPIAVDRGEANIFRLILKGHRDQGIAALQWDLVIPPELRVDLSDIVAGSAAESADKAITCAVRKKEPATIGC